jgi:hypothetical protein
LILQKINYLLINNDYTEPMPNNRHSQSDSGMLTAIDRGLGDIEKYGQERRKREAEAIAPLREKLSHTHVNGVQAFAEAAFYNVNTPLGDVREAIAMKVGADAYLKPLTSIERVGGAVMGQTQEELHTLNAVKAIGALLVKSGLSGAVTPDQIENLADQAGYVTGRKASPEPTSIIGGRG